MSEQIGGTLVFTGELARTGYRLNRMAMSLTDATNRAKFVTDEAGYMRGIGLNETEIELVQQRNWKALIEAGCSIYLLIKIAGALGIGLYDVGAHTAGMTLAQFMAKRKGQ